MNQAHRPPRKTRHRLESAEKGQNGSCATKTPNTDDAAADIDECMSEDDNNEGEEDVSLSQGDVEATNIAAKANQAKAETTNDGADADATNKQASSQTTKTWT
jgi:hypothetical protein